MKPTIKAACIVISSVFIGMATGCNKTGSDETVGEKIDKTTERVDQKLDQAGAKVEQETTAMGETIDDASITTKIKAALIAEPGLKALEINVDTANGIVTLNGTVDSPQASTRATEIARAVDGVKSVDNRLKVVAPG